MKINWEQPKGNSFQEAMGTDEYGNKYFRPAPHETCICTTPDGFKGQGWTAEEALHNAHLEGMKAVEVQQASPATIKVKPGLTLQDLVYWKQRAAELLGRPATFIME